MSRIFKLFRADDDGAVTVDWVVLTAAIVGLGVAVAVTIGSGATNTSTSVGAKLSSQAIMTY